MSLRDALAQQREKWAVVDNDAGRARVAVLSAAIADEKLTADECRRRARSFRRFGNYAGSLAWGEVADLIEREGQ